MTKKQIIKKIIECFKSGGKLLIFGNGGSAAQAQHMAAEFMGKFEYDREPLPAIALTTDTSFLTAWSNDKEYDTVFSRQIKALGKPGDIVIGISTSGKSKNVLAGLILASERGLITIDFPRHGKTTAIVQEYQLKLMHDICREVEKSLL